MTQKENNIDALVAAADALAEAAKPLSGYIDKASCKITMVWQDGDYISTYTDTLKPQQFFDLADAHAKYRAAREAVRKGTPPAFATSA